METHQPLASFPADGLALVVGAGGGIGGALAKALGESGRFNAVWRTARDPSALADGGECLALDLLDPASIAALATRLAAEPRPLRLAIVATGFLHDARWRPERGWRELDAAHLAHAFAVNATGPALLMQQLLPVLPREGKSAFAVLSAKVGSIGDNRLGGWWSYRASKAALNQLVRTAAVELRRARPEALCVSLHPGTVDTRLSAPFGKGGLEVRAPDDAAAMLLDALDRLGPAASGGFFDPRGEPLPW